MSKSSIDRLRGLIKLHLNECTKSDTPHVWEIMQVPAGRIALEDRIVDRIANFGETISQAVVNIEISESPEFY